LLPLACSDDAAPEVDSSVDAGSTVDTAKPLPSGLIAYWTFDEGSGTSANDAVGSNHGTLVNGPTWTAGKSGQAILFDGVDDVVNIPDATIFDFGSGDFSVSAWFKTTSAKDHHIINFRQDDNDPHIELYLAPTPFGYLGTHLLPGDVRISYETNRVDDGTWHHAAAVLQNGLTDGYKLYLDGVLVGTNTYSGSLQDWDTVHIGDMDAGSRAFDGAIDEVMVFNRALSDEEISEVYQYTAGSTR
jgi:hypothetical protein